MINKKIEKLFEGEISGKRKDVISFVGWKQLDYWLVLYCHEGYSENDRFIILFPDGASLLRCLDEGWEPNFPDYSPMAELDWCFLKLKTGDFLNQYYRHNIYESPTESNSLSLYKLYFNNEIIDIVSLQDPVLIRPGYEVIDEEKGFFNIVDKFSLLDIKKAWKKNGRLFDYGILSEEEELSD